MGSELLKIDEPIVDVKSHSTLETKNNVFLAISLIFPRGKHLMLVPSQERVKKNFNNGFVSQKWKLNVKNCNCTFRVINQSQIL